MDDTLQSDNIPDTILEVETLLKITDTAEEQNLSATSALRAGIERVRNISVTTDDTFRRALWLNILLYRQVFNTVATERMRDKLQKNLSKIEHQEDIDIDQKDVNTMFNIIDEISFKDSAMNRDGSRASLRNIRAQTNEFAS